MKDFHHSQERLARPAAAWGEPTDRAARRMPRRAAFKKAAFAALLCALALALTACGGADDTRADGASGAALAEAPVDLDLSALSGTVVYGQVYDMVAEPQNYLGQRIRVRGDFNYFQNPDTGREYFAAVIADATACCAQGIEFVRAGAPAYPQDYPAPGTTITVTGTFDIYEEDGYPYIQLLDADMRW